jgi:hypothetical protein
MQHAQQLSTCRDNGCQVLALLPLFALASVGTATKCVAAARPWANVPTHSHYSDSIESDTEIDSLE